MSPVLFLFLKMAFNETLNEATAMRLSKAKISHRKNSPRLTGQLMSHQPGNFTSGTLFDLFCMIYVYDGEFVFGYRNYIERGITLLSNHFA